MMQGRPDSDDPTGEEKAIEVGGTNANKRLTLDPETTLDLLKALENAAIVIEEPAPPVPQPAREPSYNPYDRAPAKPSRKP